MSNFARVAGALFAAIFVCSLALLPAWAKQYVVENFNQAGPMRQDLLEAITWSIVTSYMQGPDIGHWAAFHYDMMRDIPKIAVPVLLLSDTRDAVHHMDKRLAAARPDFSYVEFSNGGALEFMTDPIRWANIYSAWRGKVVKPR